MKHIKAGSYIPLSLSCASPPQITLSSPFLTWRRREPFFFPRVPRFFRLGKKNRGLAFPAFQNAENLSRMRRGKRTLSSWISGFPVIFHPGLHGIPLRSKAFSLTAWGSSFIHGISPTKAAIFPLHSLGFLFSIDTATYFKRLIPWEEKYSGRTGIKSSKTILNESVTSPNHQFGYESTNVIKFINFPKLLLQLE